MQVVDGVAEGDCRGRDGIGAHGQVLVNAADHLVMVILGVDLRGGQVRVPVDRLDIPPKQTSGRVLRSKFGRLGLDSRDAPNPARGALAPGDQAEGPRRARREMRPFVGGGGGVFTGGTGSFAASSS